MPNLLVTQHLETCI